jgi:hypothetical protein
VVRMVAWPRDKLDLFQSGAPFVGQLPGTNQFLLGYASVQTTERYLGTRQNLVQAVNDHLPVAPDLAPRGL